MLFSATMAATVVPYNRAIAESVSPLLTVYELAPEVVAEDEDWDLFVLADEDDDADEFPPL